jgi:hypothetical protein
MSNECGAINRLDNTNIVCIKSSTRPEMHDAWWWTSGVASSCHLSPVAREMRTDFLSLAAFDLSRSNLLILLVL